MKDLALEVNFTTESNDFSPSKRRLDEIKKTLLAYLEKTGFLDYSSVETFSVWVIPHPGASYAEGRKKRVSHLR